MGEVVKIVDSKAKAKRDNNKMLVDRIEGASGQSGGDEVGNDPNNPNSPHEAEHEVAPLPLLP